MRDMRSPSMNALPPTRERGRSSVPLWRLRSVEQRLSRHLSRERKRLMKTQKKSTLFDKLMEWMVLVILVVTVVIFIFILPSGCTVITNITTNQDNDGSNLVTQADSTVGMRGDPLPDPVELLNALPVPAPQDDLPGDGDEDNPEPILKEDQDELSR